MGMKFALEELNNDLNNPVHCVNHLDWFVDKVCKSVHRPRLLLPSIVEFQTNQAKFTQVLRFPILNLIERLIITTFKFLKVFCRFRFLYCRKDGHDKEF